jgi:hypothetical protein
MMKPRVNCHVSGAQEEGRIMLVRDARTIAREWVIEEGSRIPGFDGAYLLGSISSASDDAPFGATSDIDLKVILGLPAVDSLPHKFVFRGLVFDVAYAPSDEFGSPEAVLRSYPTAVHFAGPSVILDPSGKLTEIQEVVSREYARRVWVRKRCEHARDQFLAFLGMFNPAAPVHEQATIWTLGLAATTHMVLVADLRNPTIRRCMAVSREVLAAYGHLSLHEALLRNLGSDAMGREEVEGFLVSCADAFDAASAVRRTPFPWDSNISAFARPIAIEGAQEMIDQGCHREAMLWIEAIHTLAQTALDNDAPEEVQARLTPAYQHLLAGLGVRSPDDMVERHVQLRRLLPDIWTATEQIIATNPAIRD